MSDFLQPKPQRITGIDPGEVNLGLATTDPTTMLSDLYRINLRKFRREEVGGKTPKGRMTNAKVKATRLKEAEVVPVVRAFLSSGMMKTILTKTTVVVIERQKISMKLIKHIAYALHHEVERMYPHIKVYQIDPVSYRAFWGIRLNGRGLTRAQSHRERKMMSLFDTDVIDEEDMDRVIQAFTKEHPDAIDALLMVTYYISNESKVVSAEKKTQSKLMLTEPEVGDFVVPVLQVHTYKSPNEKY